MTLDELIAQLTALRDAHGGGHDVMVRADPDQWKCGGVWFQDNSDKGYWRQRAADGAPVYRPGVSFFVIDWKGRPG